MKKIKINKNIFFTVIIFISFFGAFFVLYTSVDKIISLKSQINERFAELDSLYKQGKFVKKVKSEFEKIKSESYVLDEAILKYGDELKLITILEDTATKYSLEQKISIGEIDDKAKNNKEEMIELPINVSLQGLYPDIIKYIKDLEESYFYINWTDVTINSTNKLSTTLNSSGSVGRKNVVNTVFKSDGKVKVNLSGVTYWIYEN